MKQATVWCRGRRAGTLTEDENGYTFVLLPYGRRTRFVGISVPFFNINTRKLPINYP